MIKIFTITLLAFSVAGCFSLEQDEKDKQVNLGEIDIQYLKMLHWDGLRERKLRLLLEQEDVRRVGEYFPFLIPVQAMNNLFVFMFLCFAIHVV